MIRKALIIHAEMNFNKDATIDATISTVKSYAFPASHFMRGKSR
jgi:hypothetical protein